jgi:hypothetical protein
MISFIENHRGRRDSGGQENITKARRICRVAKTTFAQ